ncbi:hypothetical protein FJ692_17295 [Pseudomonas fluorescens]|nr:hypothetical protein FJ692_17295 [Pseudomonas fluorescens]
MRRSSWGSAGGTRCCGGCTRPKTKIVPTLRVGMDPVTLCVTVDAERLWRRSHAERGNDQQLPQVSPGPVPLSGPTAPHSAPVQNQTQCRSTSNRQTR